MKKRYLLLALAALVVTVQSLALPERSRRAWDQGEATASTLGFGPTAASSTVSRSCLPAFEPLIAYTLLAGLPDK